MKPSDVYAMMFNDAFSFTIAAARALVYHDLDRVNNTFVYLASRERLEEKYSFCFLNLVCLVCRPFAINYLEFT